MTHISSNPNALQTYQIALYQRPLHPELFNLRDRRVVSGDDFELDAWLMPGGHLLRFEHDQACFCELVTDKSETMPQSGIVEVFYCAGEHEFEHEFSGQGVTYMTNAQTEELSENLYMSTFDEMLDHAASFDVLSFRWEDETGPCLSILDIQRYSREIHAQSFHLLARGGLVLRTQTLFEIKPTS